VACGKLGVITVVLNPANSPGQTIAAVQHVSAKSIILGTVIEPPYREPRSNSAHFEKLIEAATSMPSLQHVFKIGDFLEDSVHGASTVKDFSDLFNPCDTAKNSFSLPEHISCDTILNLQFTSGTTAAPKAVSLTHKNVLNNARQIGWQMGFTPSDVICCPFPMFHCSGLVVGFLASFVHGTIHLRCTNYSGQAAHAATELKR
jgi:acyl-CoA synthetase (AMP-forming)/AMP-acid ligase II